MNRLAKGGIILLLAGVGLYGLALAMPRGKAAPANKVPVVKKAALKPVMPVNNEDLVGKYYFGDGLGVNCRLELEADHTFRFRWTGCMGEYDRNEGTWEIQGDLMVLSPKEENEHEGFEGVNVRFLPTIWQKKLFLIDEYEAPGFFSNLEMTTEKGLINAIHGDGFVKVDEKGDQAVLKKDDFVSPRFADFVGKKPIVCKVTAVLPNGHVLLDKGSAAGLRTGLMLGPDEWYTGDLEILSVTEKTAEAVPGYFFNSETKVKVGFKYATGGGMMTPHGTGWERLAKPPEKKEAPKAARK